jgi:hypothetical protein
MTGSHSRPKTRLFSGAKTVGGTMPVAEELSAKTSHFRAREAAE